MDNNNKPVGEALCIVDNDKREMLMGVVLLVEPLQPIPVPTRTFVDWLLIQLSEIKPHHFARYYDSKEYFYFDDSIKQWVSMDTERFTVIHQIEKYDVGIPQADAK